MPVYRLRSLEADGTPLAFVSAMVRAGKSGILDTFDGQITQLIEDDDVLAKRFREPGSTVTLTGVIDDGRRLEWSPGITSHNRNPRTGMSTFELVNVDSRGVVLT
jgi:hypothetical protein